MFWIFSTLHKLKSNIETGSIEIVLTSFFSSYLFHRLTIQPHFSNATASGDIIIDIVRDPDEKGFPPIVLDINNITISNANGK